MSVARAGRAGMADKTRALLEQALTLPEEERETLAYELLQTIQGAESDFSADQLVEPTPPRRAPGGARGRGGVLLVRGSRVVRPARRCRSGRRTRDPSGGHGRGAHVWGGRASVAVRPACPGAQHGNGGQLSPVEAAECRGRPPATVTQGLARGRVGARGVAATVHPSRRGCLASAGSKASPKILKVAVVSL